MITQFLVDMKYITFTIFIALSGCTHYQPFSLSDKARSYEPFKEVSIGSISTFSIGTPEYRELDSDIASFMQNRTAFIIGKEDFAKDEVEYSSRSQEAENGKVEISFKFSVGNSGYMGQAALVSNDGYFLTAAHVVDSPQSRIAALHFDSENQNGELRVVPFRKVLVDSDADFAIIKAEVFSPSVFKMAKTSLSKGDRIFCGGWLNGGASSGVVNKIEQMESTLIDSYERTRATSPTRKGDSGSAAINENGELSGVVVAVSWGVRKFSILVQPDLNLINEIIETDRKQNGTNKKELAIGTTRPVSEINTSS